MPVLDVYSRPGCHLCEVLIEALAEVAAGRADIVVHDVDERPDWRARYGTAVPVVVLAGRELCRHRLDPAKVTQALAASA